MINAKLLKEAEMLLVKPRQPDFELVDDGDDELWQIVDTDTDDTFEAPCKRSGFPGCCGADIVHDFQNGSYTSEQIAAFYVALSLVETSWVFATTAPSQKSAIALLMKSGFVNKFTFQGNSGTLLTFWEYNTKS